MVKVMMTKGKSPNQKIRNKYKLFLINSKGIKI